MGLDIYVEDENDGEIKSKVLNDAYMLGSRPLLEKLFDGSYENAVENFKEAMRNIEIYTNEELGDICHVASWILRKCDKGDIIVINY